jgi:hypothetical protein
MSGILPPAPERHRVRTITGASSPLANTGEASRRPETISVARVAFARVSVPMRHKLFESIRECVQTFENQWPSDLAHTANACGRLEGGARHSDRGSPCNRRRMTPLRLCARIATLSLVSIPAVVPAQPSADARSWRVSYGPSAYHFSQSDEHVRYNHLVSLELLDASRTFWRASRSQIGLALFDNSFGQFSQYAFVGLEWDLASIGGAQLFASVTGGILHGYRGPYRDKIPFNSSGFAPAIVPAAGIRYGSWAVGANVLGANGFLVSISKTFD